MKALVYPGPGLLAPADKPTPVIESLTDAIVKIRKMTTGGTDLNITKGDVPIAMNGRIPRHEGVGIIEQIAAMTGGRWPRSSYDGPAYATEGSLPQHEIQY